MTSPDRRMSVTGDGDSVAVVTGGAGGMGLATAQILGRKQRVVLCDARKDRLDRAAAALQANGVDCRSVHCDVTDPDAVQAVAEQAAALGTVQSVVHTAGVSPSMTDAVSVLRINALGTVNVSRAFLPVMRPGTALVNVASTAGHLPRAFPVPRRAYRLAESDAVAFMNAMRRRVDALPKAMRPGVAYSLSKNFVIWYSRRLAAPFGQRGARVLSVSPGSFDTEMGQLEKDVGAGALAECSALRRFGRPEEIAEVLAFCATDRASYLTGTDILVDGGASAVMTVQDLISMFRNAKPSLLASSDPGRRERLAVHESHPEVEMARPDAATLRRRFGELWSLLTGSIGRLLQALVRDDEDALIAFEEHGAGYATAVRYPKVADE